MTPSFDLKPGISSVGGRLNPSRIIVVGAGLVGSCVAWQLAKQAQALNSTVQIKVIDIDLEGSLSSSELNAGGVRATWNHPLNSELSRQSISYFETVKQEIGFHQTGYCWMYSKEQWETAKVQFEKNVHWKGLGIEYLSPEALQKKFPFINKISDLGGATFSPKDGIINPNLLKLHYRNHAQTLGVEFIGKTWVSQVSVSESSLGQPQTFTLNGAQFSHLNPDELEALLTNPDKQKSEAKPVTYEADIIVNCTGAWANQFTRAVCGPGAEVHSFACRRQISFFDCRDADLTSYGMFVDPSGVYFHSEATNILAGYAVPQEPEGYSYKYDGDDFFQEFIWAPLYERSTCFENLKHVSGWAGLYEVSTDHFPIMGRVTQKGAPIELPCYEAHSFSGRGAMQSYAAGVLLAELILTGQYQSLDASPLSSARFNLGQSLSEGLVI